MADRVPFLVRLDPEVMAGLKRWANDDLRSLNAQIEFLLRRALVDSGRTERATRSEGSEPEESAAP